MQENIDHFMARSEYDVKGEATVKFKVGSAKISPEDEEKLKQLAQTATDLKGYIVEVMGYALWSRRCFAGPNSTVMPVIHSTPRHHPRT
jgi:hypothetical protein